MYKILYQWSESYFSFSLLSYWQAERTPNATPSAPSLHLKVQFSRSVHALCPLPCPWRPVEPQPWAIYQQKTARSSEQRQQSQAPDLPTPAERSHGRGTGSPGPLRAECRDSTCAPSEQHSTNAAVHNFRCLDIPQAHRKMLGFIWPLIKYKWHAGGCEPRDVVIPSPPCICFSQVSTQIFYIVYK